MRVRSGVLGFLVVAAAIGGWAGGGPSAGEATGSGVAARSVLRAAAPAVAAAPVPSRPLVVRGSTWHLRSSLSTGPATATFSFGSPYAFPVSGDWDGDRTPTVGTVLGSTWSLRNANTSGPADVTFRFGSPGDLPLVGDWDGDGVDTPGILRGNTWHLRNALGTGPADVVLAYGSAGDVPLVGDWNGDGVDTPGIRRGNVWHLRNSLGTGPADVVLAYGSPGDQPVAGDWDGDGDTTPGVVRGNTWHLSNTGVAADVVFAYGSGTEVALPSTAALARSAGGSGAPAALAGQDLTVAPTSRKVVALTFDAGADAAGVASIVATLSRTSTPATFFLTGAWVGEFPVQARQISQRYPVGNHTVSHPDLTELTDAQVRAQVTTAATQIRAATAYDTHPLFRFPFGARDARRIALVNGLGYTGVRWTVDTLGWKGTSGGQSVRSVADRVVNGARPGEIVLMHVGANPDDGSTLDAAALPTVIAELKARGYGFVTLPEVIR